MRPRGTTPTDGPPAARVLSAVALLAALAALLAVAMLAALAALLAVALLAALAALLAVALLAALAALLAVALLAALAALLSVALLAALTEGGLLLAVVLAGLVAAEPRLLLGVEVLLVAAVLELLRVHAELVEQIGVLLWVYLLHALHLLGCLLVVAAELSDQIQDLTSIEPHGDSFQGARVAGGVPCRRGTYTATPVCKHEPGLGEVLRVGADHRGQPGGRRWTARTCRRRSMRWCCTPRSPS